MPDAVGAKNAADSDDFLLPSFVERRAAGLFVDPDGARQEDAFRHFVDQVFSVGMRFVGLDYAVFQSLLYDLGEPSALPVKVADEIVPFDPERLGLYRSVKIAPDKNAAEYMFEPVEIEVKEPALVFGPPDENGHAEIIGEEIRTHSVPTHLDFDEFVAALWAKEIRFGIDAKQVQEAIAGRQAVRMQIAHGLAPTSGSDATLEEKTDSLRRDNAPKILPDGRMDLRQFRNRFPQIVGGARLLQKIPRRLGRPGYDVTGTMLEPEMPKDFELAALAGPGTRVVKGADGEFIISARDGFLNIDNQTNQVSVTEKIISREGVSMKTTGDVALTGDEFEEHGEVQERRVVEGRHMTFFADVYGNIVSRGGRVVLKSSIAGGQVTSPGGSITVEGRASRAVLEARGGNINVDHAEGCSIVGSRVTIKQAINCDILGEVVQIQVSEGSAVAGRHVKIAQSTTRKEVETIVALLVPDFSRTEHEIAELEAACQQAEKLITVQDEKIAAMLDGNPGFKQYLALAATISKGGARLSAQHEANWRQAQAANAPLMREWQGLQQVRSGAQKKLEELRATLADLAEKKLHGGDGIACAIAEIHGDTLVRRLAYQSDQSIVGGNQAQEIFAHLREFGISDDRLFWASSGEFAWRHGKGICAIEEI